MPHAERALTRRAMLTLAAGPILIGGVSRAANGWDDASKAPAASDKESEAQRRRARWSLEAKEYKIEANTTPVTPLQLEAEPILRWANPIRGGNGLVFLWTLNGRPAAVMCAYRSPVREGWTESREFHSLWDDTILGSRDGRTIWATKGAGLTWSPIPGASPPAAKGPERLKQLRSLAREFHVIMQTNQSPTELRLLSQPVYRYGAETQGAMFAFVLTTDCDAWLLIEERRTNNAPAWHYAFARMNSFPLTANHGEHEVWQAPRDQQYTEPSRNYFVLSVHAPDPEP